MNISTHFIPALASENFLAAFQLFLQRYGQQETVVLVVPVEASALAGLTSRFDPARTFQQASQQVLSDLNTAERFNLSQLEAISGPKPAFQVFCHSRLATEPVFLSPERCQALGFALALQSDGSAATWYFDEKLYPPVEVERITGAFAVFLERLLANPGAPCSSLSFLAPQDYQHFVVELNQTEADYPRNLTLPQLFEAWADRTPEAVAVVFRNETITYDALEKRANRLAYALQQRGIRPGMPVGLFLERGIELIAAQLGVLKAGGIFAALDPQFPREALLRLFETVPLSLIITRSEFASNLPKTDASHLLLDAAGVFTTRPLTRPPSPARPEDPALLLFTSGSTGLPKAVLHTHRNLVARFYNTREVCQGFEPAAAMAQLSPISSIDSLDEVFIPLVFGARTVILPYETVIDPHRLVGMLASEGVTHILLVPSLLRVILSAEADLDSKLSALKTWMVGGETLSGALARQFYEKLPQGALINYYGLTEGDAAAYIARRDEFPATIPVGGPGRNTKIYLLDDYLNPVPVGLPGEIYLAGEGLFREYFNRPELNAERWVENPFSAHPAYRRLFRTGDLGRYLPEGEIEYVGRRDRMVKIRGFRVELGEVEAAFARHPAVSEVIAAAKTGKAAKNGATSQQRLLVYVILRPDEQVSSHDLLVYAREHLADFAVPSAVVILEKFPLLPSGKVDVKSLPEPHGAAHDIDSGFVAPRNPVEAQLAALWEDLLQRRPVGIGDNFFDIGGDSLAAIDLMLRIEKKFQKSLPISALLQAPTLAALADLLTTERPPAWSSLVPIQPAGKRPPLFCVHADGGVLFYYAFARVMNHDIPIYGLQARGLLGTHNLPLTSIEDMASHYIREIRTVQPEGPYHLCAFSAGGLVIYEMARQLRAEGEEVAFLGMLDAYGPNYPNLLPGKTVAGYKISVHLNTLRLHSFTGQLDYLWRRARKRTGVILANLTGRILTTLRLPLPHLVRYNYIARLIDQASNHYYTGQTYDGDVYLFRANIQPEGIVSDPSLGWRELVTGVLKIVDITGTHNSVMKEPHLLDLVHALEICLNELPQT